MTVREKRKDYFDVMRLLATFAVVLLHTAAKNWAGTPYTTWEWHMMSLYDSMARWGVPVFVMMSGALFLPRRHTLKDLYGRKILRLAVAYAFWQALYILVGYKAGTPLQNTALQFFKGHYHMWFIPMICGLYMIVPLLQKIYESEKLSRYFLILWLIFSVFLPQLQSVVAPFSKAGGDILNMFVNRLRIRLPLDYAGYFLLGACLDRMVFKPRTLKFVYIAGFSGFIMTVLGTIIMTYRSGKQSTVFLENQTLNVVFMSIAVFLWCRHRFAEPPDFSKDILRKLSRFSFGAYLIHAMLIDQLYLLTGVSNLSFNPLISIPILTISVYAAAFLLSSLIHQIPLLNRYIV